MRRSAAVLAMFLLGCGSSAPRKGPADPCAPGPGGLVSFQDATLTVAPTVYSFPATAEGSDSAPAKFTVTNIGCESTGPPSLVIDGSSEFVITTSTCGPPLIFQGSCEVTVLFRPRSPGRKAARLVVAANPGHMFAALLEGAAPAPDAAVDGATDAEVDADAPELGTGG